MSTDRILSLLAELKECGTKIIALWGGEPLIHRDVGRIIKTAHSLGMYIYMTTNGYLLTPENRKMLIESNINSISVSIDHTRPEEHDTLRGVKGSFHRIIEGLKGLVTEARGSINTGINMVVQKDNISEIVPLATLARELGVHWFKMMPLHEGYPFSTRSFEDSDMVFSPEESEKFLQAVHDAENILRKGGLYTNSRYYRRGMGTYFTGADAPQQCKAGYLLVNIDSYGNVSLCTRDKRTVGNIRRTAFRKVWLSEELEQIRKESDRPICHHCWLSCFVEPSMRLYFSFHVRNISSSLKELAFVRGS
jgi:MoaA/NifB/PqqE/SkfB family radical SAM enzyme